MRLSCLLLLLLCFMKVAYWYILKFIDFSSDVLLNLLKQKETILKYVTNKECYLNGCFLYPNTIYIKDNDFKNPNMELVQLIIVII